VLPTDSSGYNFSDDDSCGFTATGGPTMTLLPAATSPLVDAIPVANCHDDGAATLDTDQRGVTRPQGSGCDIGAVELEAVVPVTPVEPPAAPTPVTVAPRFTG
jgi:hypothetical protein